MKTKEDFKFLIGKTIEQSKQFLEKPYFITIVENDGRSIYASYEYCPHRIKVCVTNSIISRIDDVS